MARVLLGCAGLLAALSCASCLAVTDPLGGPHGGAGGYVPPSDDASWPEPDSGVAPDSGVEDSGHIGPDSGPPEDSGDPDSEHADSGHDAGEDADHDSGHDSGHDTGPPPPTWDDIFTKYVASGTKGGCGGCHGLSTAKDAYDFLKQGGQIDGTSSAIVTSGSDFSWFGGFMPPGGPSSYPEAVADMKAWVAAGALDN